MPRPLEYRRPKGRDAASRPGAELRSGFVMRACAKRRARGRPRAVAPTVALKAAGSFPAWPGISGIGRGFPLSREWRKLPAGDLACD
ncbi:MAG: hypothetical protein LBE35_03740 [Clostridiales bacterium]|nr:hypothetical protein [Clostridiales bacterium]